MTAGPEIVERAHDDCWKAVRLTVRTGVTLARQLRRAVNRFRQSRVLFVHRHSASRSVDFRRRNVDEPLDAGFASLGQQHERAGGVHFMILDRVADAMAHSAAREMEDNVDARREPWQRRRGREYRLR